MLGQFLDEAAGQLDAIEAGLLQGRAPAEALTRLAALRGDCMAAGLTRMERIARALEGLIGAGGATRPLILRGLMRLRDIVRAVSHAGVEPPGDDSDLTAAAAYGRAPSLADTLAQARDRLLEIAPGARDPRLSALLARLEGIKADLADAEQTQPIAACLAPLMDIVEREASAHGKRIALSIDGDLAIEPGAAEPLREAVTEIVRNACKHGVEAPEARRRAGKPDMGHIRISAHRGPDFSAIEIADDGCGFDCTALRARAIEASILPADAVLRMADAEIARLMLTPDLSSAIGGPGRRGLGAANAAIDLLGGQLRVSASSARGAALLITIPDIGAHLAGDAIIYRRRA